MINYEKNKYYGQLLGPIQLFLDFQAACSHKFQIKITWAVIWTLLQQQDYQVSAK
jgi:hypothetical protein